MVERGFLHSLEPREIERQLLAIPRYLRMISVSKLIIAMVAGVLLTLVIVLPLMQSDESAIRIAFNQVPDAESDNTQPRMKNPRFESVDSDNQPFTISAVEAVQLDSDTVQLIQMKADIAMNDGAWIALEAKQGALQLGKKRLYLKGDIQILSNDGNEVNTQEAYIDLADGSATGRLPVSGQGTMGSLKADSFTISGEGDVLTFVGNVHLVLYP